MCKGFSIGGEFFDKLIKNMTTVIATIMHSWQDFQPSLTTTTLIADREYGKDINKRVYREVLSLGVVFFEKNAYIKMKVD